MKYTWNNFSQTGKWRYKIGLDILLLYLTKLANLTESAYERLTRVKWNIYIPYNTIQCNTILKDGLLFCFCKNVGSEQIVGRTNVRILQYRTLSFVSKIISRFDSINSDGNEGHWKWKDFHVNKAKMKIFYLLMDQGTPTTNTTTQSLQ